MRDDIDTLLRDAGREPTIDLDVAGIHSAGVRRNLTRRVATGAGALALLGGLALGVPNLLSQQLEIAPIDVPPTEAPENDGGTGTASEEASGVTDADLASRSGMTVVRLEYREPSGSFDVTHTSPEGDVWSGLRWRDAEGLGEPVVALDGAIWMLAPDGSTVRRDIDGEVATLATPADGGGLGSTSPVWLPLTAVDGDAVLVVEEFLGDGVSDGAPRLQVMRADGTREALPGVDVDAAIDADERVWAAAAAPELTVAIAERDDAYRVVALPAGAEPLVLLSTSEPGHQLLDVAYVDGRAWVLQRIDDGARNVLHVLDPTGVQQPRQIELDPGDTVAVEGAASSSALLLVSLDDGDPLPRAAYLDVRELGQDVTDLRGSELLRPLAQRGLVGFADPLDRSGMGGLAACATDEDVRFNTRPESAGALIYLCWDAMATLPSDQFHPYVATTRADGGDGTTTPAQLEQLLRTWAEGPTEAEEAAGLSGGLDPEVGSIGSVTASGTQVTVDILAGESVGVLGTTNGGATFTTAITGMVLQYDQFESVVITLDGSCEAFQALGDADDQTECSAFTQANTPWGQVDGSAAAACEGDTDRVDAAPSGADPHVWWVCESGTSHGIPMWRSDALFTAADFVSQDALLAAVVDVWASGPSQEQRAAGVSGGFEPGVITLNDVSVDGGVVSIDVTLGPEWDNRYSTSYQSQALVLQLSGLVFQFDGYDSWRFTVDGGCDRSPMSEVEPCAEYDRATGVTPWTQSG